jgi:hypothetical protein
MIGQSERSLSDAAFDDNNKRVDKSKQFDDKVQHVAKRPEK